VSLHSTKEERAAYQRQYRLSRKALGTPIRDTPTWEENQRSRLKRYGLTLETYTALYEQQGCACAICKQPLKLRNTQEDRTLNTHVDHCHTTGKVRGLLCSGCNLGLGHFKDDHERLTSAIAYLKP
jgi:hypothetical protein